MCMGFVVDVRKGGADYSGYCGSSHAPFDGSPPLIQNELKFPLTRSNSVGGEPSEHHGPKEKATEGESVRL